MINEQEIANNKGNYIRFGGRGIIDGLKMERCKAHFLKIIDVVTQPEDDAHIILRYYHAKRKSYLPKYNYNQEYEIITEKEFKTLPRY